MQEQGEHDRNRKPGGQGVYAEDQQMCIRDNTMTGREDDYTWSEAYMANQQVFVVTAESGIKTLADLAGKVVEVQAESSAEAALKDDPDLTGTFGTLQTTPDYNLSLIHI